MRGVRWVGAARVAAEIASFGAAIALARLIPPTDFGYYAVVAILFVLAAAVAADGITGALVRLPAIDRGHLEGAALLALAVGAAATAAVLVLAPLLRPLYGDEIAELLQLAAPAFLIAGVGAVSRAILQRRLEFRRIGLVDAASTLAGLSVSIGLALAGLDASALIVGALAGQALGTALMLLLAPPPRPRRRPEIGELRRFAVPHSGAQVAAALAQNVDYAVLAARASPATVGFYWRGYQVGVEWQRKLSGVLTGLALPLYARSANRGEQLLLRSRIVRLQTALIAPLLIVLAVEAPYVIPAIFGERWEPAVLPTQILTAAGFLATAQSGTGPLIAAVGRPGAMLRWNVGNIVLLGALVYVVAPEGLVTLSLAVLGFRLVRFAAAYELLLRRIAGVPLRALGSDLAPSVVAGCGALAAGFACRELLLEDAPGLAELAGVGLTVLGVYAALLRGLFPRAASEVIDALVRLTRRGGTPPAPGVAPA